MLNRASKRKLRAFANRIFDVAERKRWVRPRPTFELDYHKLYPKLSVLEAHYDAVRAETLALIADPESLVDIASLNKKYTGPHAISWKTFVLKHEAWKVDNCARCPETTKLLQQIPGLSNAFFSVLGARQHISPHWGFYRGFIRYHLGVVIPNDNEDHSCYLRINTSYEDNDRRDTALIEKGDKYYWKNGQGVLFDDMFLHDAENASDEARVVLWLDLEKTLPGYLKALNKLVIRYGGPIPDAAI